MRIMTGPAPQPVARYLLATAPGKGLKVASDSESSILGPIPNEHRDCTCEIVAGGVGASPFGCGSRDAGSAREMALGTDTIALGSSELGWIDDCERTWRPRAFSSLHGGNVMLSRTMTPLAADTVLAEGLFRVVAVLGTCYWPEPARMAKQAGRLHGPCEVDIVLPLESWRCTVRVPIRVIRDGRLIQESALLGEQKATADTARSDEVGEFSRDVEWGRFTLDVQRKQSFRRKLQANVSLRRRVGNRYGWNAGLNTADPPAALSHRCSGIASRNGRVTLGAHLAAHFLGSSDIRNRKRKQEN